MKVGEMANNFSLSCFHSRYPRTLMFALSTKAIPSLDRRIPTPELPVPVSAAPPTAHSRPEHRTFTPAPYTLQWALSTNLILQPKRIWYPRLCEPDDGEKETPQLMQ